MANKNKINIMGKPKPETEQKLKSIATSFWIDIQKRKCDVDVVNQHNFIHQCKKRAEKLNIGIAYETITRHKNVINKYLNDWWSNKIEQQRLDEQRNKNDVDAFFNGIETKPTYVAKTNLKKAIQLSQSQTEDKLIKIQFIYQSGKTETKSLVDVEIEQVEQPILWTGLFDYKKTGEIVIQRGGYKGINIKNFNQVITKFGSVEEFRKWCAEKIDDAEKGRIMIKSDTPRDVETLKKVIAKIDNLFANF